MGNKKRNKKKLDNNLVKDKKLNSKNKSTILSIAALLVSCFAIYVSIRISDNSNAITLSLNKESSKNYNLNYMLQINDSGVCQNTALAPVDENGSRAEGGTLFFTNAFYFDLIKGDTSGSYSNKYVGVLNGEDLLLKEVLSKNIVFSNSDFKSSINFNDVKVKKNDDSCIKENGFALYFMDLTSKDHQQVNPVLILHVILKGYNGEYQYFTVINYLVDNGEVYMPFKSKIIGDAELYDNDITNDIVKAINNPKYPNYKVLKDQIEKERNIIKNKLK